MPSDAGEDDIVRCRSCGYAANVERAVAVVAPVDDPPGGTLERFATPGIRTIAALAAAEAEAPPERQIKTMVFVLDGQVTLVLLRGDHELSVQKLLDNTGATTGRPAGAEECVAALGASPGSLGAVGVTDLPVLADGALAGPQQPHHRGQRRRLPLPGGGHRTRHRRGRVAGFAPGERRRALHGLWEPAGAAPLHRDRAHLQTGTALRRGLRDHGHGRRRHPTDPHDGQLRHRHRASRGRRRRDPPRRARPLLAGLGGPLRGGRRPAGRPGPRRSPK